MVDEAALGVRECACMVCEGPPPTCVGTGLRWGNCCVRNESTMTVDMVGERCPILSRGERM